MKDKAENVHVCSSKCKENIFYKNENLLRFKYFYVKVLDWIPVIWRRIREVLNSDDCTAKNENSKLLSRFLSHS
jgi:hypothetical protein